MLSSAIILSLPLVALAATTAITAGPTFISNSHTECNGLVSDAAVACAIEAMGVATPAASYIVSIGHDAGVSSAIGAIGQAMMTDTALAPIISSVALAASTAGYDEALLLNDIIAAKETQIPSAQRAAISSIVAEALSLDPSGAKLLGAMAPSTAAAAAATDAAHAQVAIMAGLAAGLGGLVAAL